MEFYRFYKKLNHGLGYYFKISLKCLWIMFAPVLPALVITKFWYQSFFLEGLYFSNDHIGGVETFILTVGVIYALQLTLMLNTVWEKYRIIRLAVKQNDFETFADYADEELTPLMHTLIGSVSLFLLVGFFVLPYPSASTGAIVVSAISYLLIQFFMVTREMDNPLGGIWFIQHIPDHWLKVNVKKYRESREKREKQMKQ